MIVLTSFSNFDFSDICCFFFQPKKDGKNLEANMKEWILRYAEQQNEEKSETSKSLEEEKFDPVSRNLC